MVTTGRDDVFVTAVKAASRGQGWIVRLGTNTVPAGEVVLSMQSRKIKRAWLCDARERDLRELRVTDRLTFSMPGAISSVRLVCDE